MTFTFEFWQLALLLLATIVITAKVTKFFVSVMMFISTTKGELFMKGRDGEWMPYDPTLIKKEEGK